MKNPMNHIVFIAALFISLPCFGTDLYTQGKQAYESGDCDAAVPLLRKYEQSKHAASSVLKAIGAAIAWCESDSATQLQQSIESHLRTTSDVSDAADNGSSKTTNSIAPTNSNPSQTHIDLNQRIHKGPKPNLP